MPAPPNFPTFRYVRPDEWWTNGCEATGDTDTEFEAAWLIDQFAGRPWRAPSTASASVAMTGPAGPIGIIALCNHNLQEDAVAALAGDLTDSFTLRPMPPNHIPYNAWKEVSASGVDALTLTISGNDNPPTVGEFVAGPVRELPVPKQAGESFDEYGYAIEPEQDEISSIPGYSKRAKGRVWVGQQYLTVDQLLDMIEWFDATRVDNVPPSLIIVPYVGFDDAWLVHFKTLHYEPAESGDLWLVNYEFEEYPRTRWS